MNNTTCDDSHAPIREAIAGLGAPDLLARLPRMGRLMVIGRGAGVTHERIGPVEAVTAENGRLHLTGACHDAAIDPARIAGVVLDTHSLMGGKVYPRLEFLDAGGALQFSVTGMEGVAAFTAPLADHPRHPAPPEVPEAPSAAPQELAPTDPVHAPFQIAHDRGCMVRISFDNGTLRQGWSGRIEALRPARGFLNVMTADFHLHLKGGTLSGWQSGPGRRIALDLQGVPNGLVVTSDCLA
ncbi:hypothetical protein [Paracoccus sp. (in: a-proteobacteria)]|uniref:hypothetical protein n=1 Tax=Paracoccus sp. TaxID=267 RepID=UPI0032203263